MKQTIVQSTAVGMMGGAFGLETHKPKIVEEDTAFITEKDRVLHMEQELAIASQKAERVLAAEQKHSDALGELGLECLKLSKMEEEEAGRMGSYTAAGAACQDMASQARKMGNATVRISRLSRSANNASAKSLDPLHDYLGMMPAVRKAVADRAETLLTLQTHLADVDSKKARIAKLEMDFSKMHKAEMLRRELAADEAAADEDFGDFDAAPAESSGATSDPFDAFDDLDAPAAPSPDAGAATEQPPAETIPSPPPADTDPVVTPGDAAP